MGSQKSRQSPGKTGVTQGNHFADKTPLCLGSFPRTWAGWRWWVCALKDQGGVALILRMLTGTLAALDAGGLDSPDCAPAALGSPGSEPVPQLAAACSLPPGRCEAGSAAAGSSKARMNTWLETVPAWLACLGLPRRP